MKCAKNRAMKSRNQEDEKEKRAFIIEKAYPQPVVSDSAQGVVPHNTCKKKTESRAKLEKK